MSKDLKTIFYFFLFALLLNGCKEEEKVRIGLSVWPAGGYTFIAQEKGFFKKNGVSVEIILKDDISEITELYKAGKLDGFLGVFSDIVIFNADTFFTQVVYVSEYSNTGDAIVGRSNINDLSALKGKTVSFEGINSFSHLFVLTLLEQAGISEGDYQARNIPGQQLLSALENNQIDAGHTWEPVTSQALAKGYKILGKAGDLPTLITDVFAFRKEFVDKHPKAIEAVVTSLIEASNFLRSHPNEAIPIIAKAEGISEKEMVNGIKGVHYLSLAENIDVLKPGGKLFDTGQKIIDFYIKKGQLDHSPDLTKIINGQFVQTIGSP